MESVKESVCLGATGGIASIDNPHVFGGMSFTAVEQDGQGSFDVSGSGNGGSAPFGGAGGFAARGTVPATDGMQAGGGGGGGLDTLPPGNGANGLVIVFPLATPFS